MFITTVFIWLFMGVFVLYPLARLLCVVFQSDGGYSLDNLKSILTGRHNIKALHNSVILAFSVGTCGTLMGSLFAYGIVRIRLPLIVKWLLSAITVLPFVSPPFTSSIALSLVLGPGGVILTFLGIPDFIIYGFSGTLLAETLTYFPVAFLTMLAVLSNIDSNYEEAAKSLGASKWQAFRNIVVPLCTPGLANSFLLLFAASLADFATPMVMAGRSFPVLPTQIYLQITGMYDLRGGAAISFILILPALAIYLFQRYRMNAKSYVTITGKGAHLNTPHTPDRWLSIAVITLISLTGLFILFLYGIILASSFVKVWGVDNSLTLENYRFVFTAGLNSITDTLIIAIVSTLAGTVIAVAIGYISTRKDIPATGLLEFVSLINYILPGTVLGIAYLIAFNTGPIVITGTLTIIVGLCVFRYDATGIRGTIASLKQLDPSIEEAAKSLGASSLTALRTITVPLITPAIKTGMKYLFIVSMTAVSAVIFLVSVEWSLLTVRILNSITELMFAQAAAFSVVLILIVFVAIGTINLIFRILYPGHAEC